MRKRKRSYNVRLVKATWPYSVQEIAGLFDIHKNAITRWLTEGLHSNRDIRPFLIRGDDLIRFLSERQQSRKHKCRLSEFFCFKCRAPREAYLGMADIVIESASRFRVKALCEACSTHVNKVQSIAKLDEILRTFNVQQLVGRHLIERFNPSVNSDFEAPT